ncbi:MAG TPA: hypothetical protein PLX89_10885 [Verrucomicrobiota bacterium]|nr:hypothetical protein [Verrucomicrobiales bacterium]HRI13502.1 hypothetical protein [Verrucomicrobiota bacterium]
MKSLSKVCFALGWLFIIPLILIGVGVFLPMLQDTRFMGIVAAPILVLSDLVYRIGAPEFIVGTGGHVALLTPLGLILILGLPALGSFGLAYWSRR